MRGLAAPLVKLIVFVVVTVLATAALSLAIANVNFNSSSEYRARFTDVTSLHDGDDVRIAGVKVGSVDSIKIVDKNSAEVGFEVQDDVRIPASVTAAIRYRNLIGQRYLSLQQAPGSTEATLQPGDLIPIDRTKPALDLTMLFNGFQPLFQAISPRDVNKLSSEVVQVFQGEGSTVNELLGHTASLTSKIADKDRVIGQVIDNLNSTLDTLNAHSAQFSDLITTTQQVISGFAADRKPIGDAVDTLGDLADTTQGFLQEGRRPLKDAIAELGNASRGLNRNQPKVQHFFSFLPKKLNRITGAGTYGSWFQFYSCETRTTGKLSLPGLTDKPITLPINPTLSQSSADRCKR